MASAYLSYEMYLKQMFKSGLNRTNPLHRTNHCALTGSRLLLIETRDHVVQVMVPMTQCTMGALQSERIVTTRLPLYLPRNCTVQLYQVEKYRAHNL